MATGQRNQVVRQLRGLLALRETALLSETELWHRYVHQRDEAGLCTRSAAWTRSRGAGPARRRGTC